MGSVTDVGERAAGKDCRQIVSQNQGFFHERV
jgi:hypothetical protein